MGERASMRPARRRAKATQQ
uniref:Uncharacterized protein n=1 Tax=Arundo donax TaxID=35708 RepID=A0A0A8Z2J7_ARUDO